MRQLICIITLLMVIGLAESIQTGGTTEKAILLGSLSKNSLSQGNASNETNITAVNSSVVAIKNPMSAIPVSNKYKRVDSPNSIQANSITYQFTT